MAVEVARHFNTAIRWTFKMEMDLVSMSRLFTFTDLKSEHVNKSSGIIKYNNVIEFKNAIMRYQPHLPPALSNVNLTIKRGEKIAIVGRTGAGKSTFFQLL